MEKNNLIVPAKTPLFKEGEPAEQLYIVKSGEVLCLKASKDRLIPVFMARERDVLGESAMMAQSPYTYSAITLMETELIAIPSENFDQALQAGPRWLTDLATTMVNRFQNTADMIAENRVIHPAILSEEEFPSSLEIEFKKLLSNKTE
jgi:CRP-like cAMP-binding protein